MALDLGICTSGAPASTSAMQSYIDRSGGHKPKWWLTYVDWNQALSLQEFSNAAATGSGVIVSLQPKIGTTPVSLTSIASGGQDSVLAAWAAIIAGASSPVIIRFAHEMNGTNYPWGSQNWTSAQYIAAYQYVATYFRTHAPNALHFWCPNNSPPDFTTYPVAPYYPGDGYCDYVGQDAYNFGTFKGGSWQTFDYEAGTTYDAIVAIAPSKPHIIGEMGCNPTGGDQAQWVLQAMLTTIPVRMPKVIIACWFDFDLTSSSDLNYLVSANAAIQTAWQRVTKDPIYKGSLPLTRISKASSVGSLTGAVG